MKHWFFGISLFFVLISGVLMGLAIKLDLPGYLAAFLWITVIPIASISIVINYYASKSILKDWKNK